jgi:pimeloyl-ACP methyl ester carboxylesterase
MAHQEIPAPEATPGEPRPAGDYRLPGVVAGSNRMPSLPPALSGDRVEFDSVAGRLSVYVAGRGPALLLVHSINAVGSAAEVRPLYEHFRATRTVVALDLPGFGFSDRSDRPYTPRLMTDAVLAAARFVRSAVGADGVDALAVSLGAEFLARAGAESPATFRSLALVSPTGMNHKKPLRGPPGSTLAKPGLHGLLRGPGWGEGLYRLLARPRVIRYFLERTWGARAIDEWLWRYDILTARQPGASHAPLYFLSGALFSRDIEAVYETIKAPVWMSRGTRGDFTDYRQAALVKTRPNWSFSVLPTGALPYFELPAAFCADYERFLGDLILD